MQISKLVVPSLLASNLLFAFLLIQKDGEKASPESAPESDLERLSEIEQDFPVTDLEESLGGFVESSSEYEILKEENLALQKEVAELKNELSVYNARRQRPRASQAGSGLTHPGDPMLAMLHDESTVDLALDWIRADQSRRFASLIALSEVGPLEKERLVELLTARYANRADLNQLGLEALPEEERRDIEASYQQELRSLVGDSMAELFLKAETKPLSFARIQEIDTLMRFGNQPLTQEQYLPIWNLLSNTIQVGVRMNDAASVIEVTERSINNNIEMLDEAEALLEPAQFAIFEERILADITQTRVRQHMMLQSFEQRARLEAEAAPVE
ncbi:hypothetical protein IEN85_15320 [Pelagicoccus sp. NFK12]|uniref:Uncharacterized protein n=1 Tax=Pelagicoccus enzymogenes TaxID=2773457 RepID=A0A927IIK7_9BACT|nr:hypothetical protein [Pelagicoccus enzymogenes]MBD5780868.1 hypothetical protein [Pelagicoccus enzymogenes]